MLRDDDDQPFRNVMPWFAQGVDAANGILGLHHEFLTGKPHLSLMWDIGKSRQVIETIIATHLKLSAATGGHPAANDLKDFEIWVSPSGTADSSFTKVFSGTAAQDPSLQIFTFDKPVRAQYMKLMALNNYGGDAIDVAELEAVSNTQPVIVPTPSPTATPPSTPTPVATATSVPGSSAVLTVSPDAGFNT